MLDLRPIHSPAFRHLAAACWVNEFGNWIGEIALAILVWDRTGSPLDTAALFLSLRFLPAVLAPVLTTKIEVFPARVVIGALYALEAALFAALSMMVARFTLAPVLVLAGCDGVLAITATALVRSALATELSRESLLREGNALVNLGTMIAIARAPLAAGVIVATDGAATALWVDAATFAVAALVIATAHGIRVDERHGLRLPDEAADRSEHSSRASGCAASADRHRPCRDARVGRVAGGGRVRQEHPACRGLRLRGAVDRLGRRHGGGRLRLRRHQGPLDDRARGQRHADRRRIRGLGGLPEPGSGLYRFIRRGRGEQCRVGRGPHRPPGSGSRSPQSAIMAVLEAANQVMPAVGFIVGGAITAISSPRAAYAVSAIGVAAILAWFALRPANRVQLSDPPMQPAEHGLNGRLEMQEAGVPARIPTVPTLTSE